jgi:hypothetical protein
MKRHACELHCTAEGQMSHEPRVGKAAMTDTHTKLRIYFSDRTIPVMAVVAAIGLWLALSRGDAPALGLLGFGWGIYVVEEYLVHRFIFHAPPPQRQFLFDALYRLHYGHHDQVLNKHLLFTPLWFSLPLAAIDCAMIAIFLPMKDALIAVWGGGVSAYLLFEWLHLTSHFKAASKGRLGRYITRRHSKHHYIDYSHWFTVSPGGQLVDRAFGSDPRDHGVVPGVRTCGLAENDPRLVKSRIRFGSDSSLANQHQSSRRNVRAENAA